MLACLFSMVFLRNYISRTMSQNLTKKHCNNSQLEGKFGFVNKHSHDTLKCEKFRLKWKPAPVGTVSTDSNLFHFTQFHPLHIHIQSNSNFILAYAICVYDSKVYTNILLHQIEWKGRNFMMNCMQTHTDFLGISEFHSVDLDAPYFRPFSPVENTIIINTAHNEMSNCFFSLFILFCRCFWLFSPVFFVCILSDSFICSSIFCFIVLFDLAFNFCQRVKIMTFG